MSKPELKPLPVPSPGVPLPVLVGMLLLRLVLLLAVVTGTYLVLTATGTTDPRPLALISSNVWIVGVDLATLALVARLLRREGSSGRELLGRLTGRDLARSAPVFVILAVAFFVATFVANLVVYLGPPPTGTATGSVPLWLGVWSTALMPVTIAFAEELLYRGYLLPRFQSRLGRATGFILVALGFGLQHLVFVLGDPRAMVSRVLALFLVGLVLQALYRWTRRLWPLVIGHWLLDLLFLGLPLLWSGLAR